MFSSFRRELISSVSSDPDVSTDSGVEAPSQSMSMLNRAYLPENLSTNDEEGTVSFNVTDRGRSV